MGPFTFVARISKKPLCKGYKPAKKCQFFTLFLDSFPLSPYNLGEVGECFGNEAYLPFVV